jgi:archaetidylinositol phosphate synthase
MLKSRLKSEVTDKILSPVSRLGLSPNAWSLLSLLPASLGFIALVLRTLPLALLLFAASGFVDMVDGAVARSTNSSTTAGAFIDGVLDRYVELLLILGLDIYLGEEKPFLMVPVHTWMLLLLFGAVMTSFIRAYADHRGLVKDPASLKNMGGLLERAERLMLIYIGMALGIHDTRLMVMAAALVAVLANATAIQRILFALKAP